MINVKNQFVQIPHYLKTQMNLLNLVPWNYQIQNSKPQQALKLSDYINPRWKIDHQKEKKKELSIPEEDKKDKKKLII